MPSFGRKGDLYTVSYITGPRHIWLGVAFTHQSGARPSLVKHPSLGSCHHGDLDPERIVEAVTAGARRFDRYPARIEYVENDSPAYGLYEHCAELLAERAAIDGATSAVDVP